MLAVNQPARQFIKLGSRQNPSDCDRMGDGEVTDNMKPELIVRRGDWLSADIMKRTIEAILILLTKHRDNEHCVIQRC
jgi:hypothetical protein